MAMSRYILILVIALAALLPGNLYAAQVACPSSTTLDALIALTAGGIANACFSQDKLFWNFQYTPTGSAGAASTVQAGLIFQSGVGVDVHGWNFSSSTWVQGVGGPAQFTLSFTIQVCPAGSACVGTVVPGTVINAADAVYAPISTFAPGPEVVTWSNGATVTLTSGAPGPLPPAGNIGFSGVGPITVTANFSGTGAITQTTLRFYETVGPTAQPPSISKNFGAASVPLNGTTSLSFTITNPNAAADLTGVGFTDGLPAGLVVTTPNGLSNTCGGTATATAASNTISLSGATIPAGGSCKVSVNVTGTMAGTKNNVTSNVTSTNGGTGNTASATLIVAGPPTITKSFADSQIELFFGSTTLSFTITNPDTISLTGLAFTDTLPSGLIVSTPNGLSGSCGGGTITAAPGSNSISLSGATLASGASCTFSVNVTGTGIGVQTNTTSTLTSNEAPPGNPGTASISVVESLQLFLLWFFFS